MSDISVTLSFKECEELEEASLLSADVEVVVQEKQTKKQLFDARLKENPVAYQQYLEKQRFRNKESRRRNAGSKQSPPKGLKYWRDRSTHLEEKLRLARSEIKRLREKNRYHVKQGQNRRRKVLELVRDLHKNREKFARSNRTGKATIHALKNKELMKKVQDFYNLEENTATVPDKRGKRDITMFTSELASPHNHRHQQVNQLLQKYPFFSKKFF